MASWQIGKVRVTQVVESRGATAPGFLFDGLTPGQVQVHRWLRPHFAHADGRLFMSIHCFVIESEGRRIVVDTCVGNDKERPVTMWHRLQGRFLDDMAEAGFPAGSIDTVVHTHLHADHVGWATQLVDGEWVPTFTAARHLYTERELAYSRQMAAEGAEDVYGDSVAPVLAAGLALRLIIAHLLPGSGFGVDLAEGDHAQ